MAVAAGGIGARLRTGREKLGLTVLQAAEKLHVDARILESLEAEDFAALGAPVFARGHLRHYAELVGESMTELSDLYSNSTRSDRPDLTRIAKAPAEPGTKRLVVPAVVALAVFAVVGGVLWVSSLQTKKGAKSEVNIVAPAVDSASAPRTGDATSAGTSVTGVPAVGASAAGTAVAGASTVTAHGAQPAGGPTGAAGIKAAGSARAGVNAAGAQPAGGGTTAAGAAAADAPAAPVHSKHDVKVTLRYSADSWTEVYDANGARLFYDVGAAKSVQTLMGLPPLRVVLGNAAGVSVEFNGKNTPIEKLSQPDGTAQFSINRAGRAQRARAAADGG